MIYRNHIIKQYLFYFLIFITSLLFTSIAIDVFTKGIFKHLSMDIIKTQIRNQLDVLSILICAAQLLSFLTLCIKGKKHREFSLLASSGFSKKMILAPFLYATLIVIGATVLFAEWGLPHLYSWCSTPTSRLRSQIGSYQAKHMTLQDNSSLIYRSYIPSLQELHDVFWIADAAHIWHFHTIDLKTQEGRGGQLISQNQSQWTLASQNKGSWRLPFTLAPASLLETIEPRLLPLTTLIRYSWFSPNLPSHILSKVKVKTNLFLLSTPLSMAYILIASRFWIETSATRTTMTKVGFILGLFISLFSINTVATHLLEETNFSHHLALFLFFISVYLCGFISYVKLK